MGNVSKYCYDNGVLINKYEIKNRDVLQVKEIEATTKRMNELKYMEYRFSLLDKNNPNHFDISGLKFLFRNCFDVNMYLFIHYYIFQDVYPFAGEIRDEAIYKSNEPYFHNKTPFCYPSLIYQNLNYNLSDMRDNIFKIKTRDDLVRFLSYYYGELNIVHPFREGNGRTLRMYMEFLVQYLNSRLPFSDVEIHYSLWNEEDVDELLKSTIICSLNGDTSGIERAFDKVIVYKDEKKKSR